MRGIGTVVNVVTVLAGTLVGVVLGNRLPERLRTTVLQAVGLVVLIIGGRDAFGTRNVVFPLVSLILGAVIGEALRIEDRLEALGGAIRRRFETDREGDDARFVEGFVAASLLFCVGPLTILGSIRDGLGGPDHAQLLLVKAALDGAVAVAFASTLGWGVGFSALTVIVVQGTLTLAAGAADQVLTERMVVEMSAAGGIMVIGIGLRLLDIKKVAVGSLLPALVLAPVGVALFAR
ncbi:MAG TPA: DUF554 domain-containing protein [Acidimicrobiales bacterium]|nr:DUF554 domain-containing protein [Acidimicrobiales bacterium]